MATQVGWGGYCHQSPRSVCFSKARPELLSSRAAASAKPKTEAIGPLKSIPQKADDFDSTARAAGAAVRHGVLALPFRHKYAASLRDGRGACSWATSQALLRAQLLLDGVASTSGREFPSTRPGNRWGADISSGRSCSRSASHARH